MSRKNALTPIVLESSHSLSATFSTAPTVIDWLDNLVYQIIVTTTDSIGTFSVQASLDYVPAGQTSSAPNAGTWTDLTLGGGTPTVNAANDSIIINLNQLPFHAIRLTYTAGTAGTGVAKILIEGKMI